MRDRRRKAPPSFARAAKESKDAIKREAKDHPHGKPLRVIAKGVRTVTTEMSFEVCETLSEIRSWHGVCKIQLNNKSLISLAVISLDNR